ncbi:MAG: energy transducer TonB [Candidatus Acidiferrales bacterium]
MKMLRRAASTLCVLVALTITGLAQISFKPPEVTSVTDAYRPYEVVDDGFVVLDVSLDNQGAVSGITDLRNPGLSGGGLPIVAPAESIVRKWGFRPAIAPSGPIPSEMTVVFLVRPPMYFASQIPPPRNFKPVLPEAREDSADPDYAPAGIISVAYPNYPVNSSTFGSVIVQVTVGPAGDVVATKVLRQMSGPGPFTALSTDALAKWQFQAATLRGKPVASKLAIAFVFEPPHAGS